MLIYLMSSNMNEPVLSGDILNSVDNDKTAEMSTLFAECLISFVKCKPL